MKLPVIVLAIRLDPKGITAPPYRDQYISIKEQVEIHKSMLIPWGYVAKDGTIIHVEMDFRFVEIKETKLYIAIAKKISQHKYLVDFQIDQGRILTLK